MTEPASRILLVEDEKKLAHFIERFLDSAGYTVELVHDGQEAIDRTLPNSYALIILDLNLPHKSGFEVLQEIRSRGTHTPVLILSAREKVEDRVTGLKLGADDYLMKPFDSGELSARIQALLRRADTSNASTLHVGDVRMDLLQQKVTRGGKEIPLSRREFGLLEFFIRNKNQVLTRKRIAEQVWGYTFDTGTNIVDVYVSYLRKAIDEGYEKKLIHTIVREGFVLRDEGGA